MCVHLLAGVRPGAGRRGQEVLPQAGDQEDPENPVTGGHSAG